MSEVIRDSIWDRYGVLSKMLDPVPLPKMARIAQKFDTSAVDDIPFLIQKEFSKPAIKKCINSGDEIAITVGSRGIANINLIIREIVLNVKSCGGKPFIIPAMGSHGSATADGQRAVIEALGVTEEFIGTEIRSSMDTICIGQNCDGKDVHIDAIAQKSDGIIIVGRIKPHSAFRGDFESGLYKMMAIGLGKQRGAELCHEEGFGRMAHNVKAFGNTILQKAPVIFGVAIVENSYDKISIIETVPIEKIAEREPELLKIARASMPKIYIDDIDVLIVDQIGKNFSGDGMDPNITSSYITPFASGGPVVQRYVVLDLSDETHGNGIGAGAADFATKRLYDKLDFDAAYPNALTCTVVIGAKIPLILKNDKTAIQAAVYTGVGIDKNNPRIIRIANTSNISELWASEILKDEISDHPKMDFLSDYKEMEFDSLGNLSIGN